MQNDHSDIEINTQSDIVEGRNPVNEVIKSGRTINRLWVLKPENKRYDPQIFSIITTAKNNGALVVECDRKTLDRMSVTRSHQGIIAK